LLGDHPRSVTNYGYSSIILTVENEGPPSFVIATSSLKHVLTEIGLSEVFDSELYVPSISNLQPLEFVLHAVELFQSSQRSQGSLYACWNLGFTDDENGIHIGIKKLLSIVEMARQEPDNAVERLVGALMGLAM
jgi:vesicle-fusing ATPase